MKFTIRNMHLQRKINISPILFRVSLIFLFLIFKNEKVLAQSNTNQNNALSNTLADTIEQRRNDQSYPYKGETRFVQKTGGKKSKAEKETTDPPNQVSQKNIPEAVKNQNKFNPLSNINLQTTDPKVLAKMQLNKESGLDIFEGICLVYKIQTGLDADKTNFESLLSAWRKENLFFDLIQVEQHHYLLFLDAYFDTELSEEIMLKNQLKVIFEEEYYTLKPLERKH